MKIIQEQSISKIRAQVMMKRQIQDEELTEMKTNKQNKSQDTEMKLVKSSQTNEELAELKINIFDN